MVVALTFEMFSPQLEESEQRRASLEEKLKETQQLAEDLEEKLVDSENSRATEEEISRELQEQVGRGVRTASRRPQPARRSFSRYVFVFAFLQLNQLTEELSCLRAEKEQISGAQSSAAAATEELLSKVTAEREQLRTELQENTQMVGGCLQLHNPSSISSPAGLRFLKLKIMSFLIIYFVFRRRRHKFFSSLFKKTSRIRGRRTPIC